VKFSHIYISILLHFILASHHANVEATAHALSVLSTVPIVVLLIIIITYHLEATAHYDSNRSGR
jgi:hypothetical protein